LGPKGFRDLRRTHRTPCKICSESIG
jgi:hypothetical protein